MNKISLIVSVSLLALLMGSCGLAPENQNPEQAREITRPTEPTEGSNPAGTGKNSDVQVLVEPAEPQRSANVSGLIASTNPDKRRQNIVKGRQDPFGLISVQPLKVPGIDNNNTNHSNTNKKNSTKVTVAPKVKVLPDPVLAKGVAVSGVITVEGNTKVILKAPNEKFSRYVSPGSYLSNGQVLVKRVDPNQNPPVVVLEQFGIEVVKRVGEGGENVTPNRKPEASTALIPTLPPDLDRS